MVSNAHKRPASPLPLDVPLNRHQNSSCLDRRGMPHSNGRGIIWAHHLLSDTLKNRIRLTSRHPPWPRFHGSKSVGTAPHYLVITPSGRHRLGDRGRRAGRQPLLPQQHGGGALCNHHRRRHALAACRVARGERGDLSTGLPNQMCGVNMGIEGRLPGAKQRSGLRDTAPLG